MTVGELIERLALYDPDARVRVSLALGDVEVPDRVFVACKTDGVVKEQKAKVKEVIIETI